MSMARTSGATNKGFLPVSFYRLSFVHLVQPLPYIWKEGIDTPACSPILVHFLPYTVCKERTCSFLPILVTLGPICVLYAFLWWESPLLGTCSPASYDHSQHFTPHSPTCQTNDSTERDLPHCSCSRVAWAELHSGEGTQTSSVWDGEQGHGKEKRMRIRVGSVTAILVAFYHCMGQGGQDERP